jgi:hypothetical protein
MMLMGSDKIPRSRAILELSDCNFNRFSLLRSVTPLVLVCSVRLPARPPVVNLSEVLLLIHSLYSTFKILTEEYEEGNFSHLELSAIYKHACAGSSWKLCMIVSQQ